MCERGFLVLYLEGVTLVKMPCTQYLSLWVGQEAHFRPQYLYLQGHRNHTTGSAIHSLKVKHTLINSKQYFKSYKGPL